MASYAGDAETTVYIGGLLEKVTRGSTTAWKHYIAGADGPVALYIRDSGGTNALHYLTEDHLGSIGSVTSVSGALKVRLSFSAFGHRRNAATWSGSPTSGDWDHIANTTRQGFTSHEMLDNLVQPHAEQRGPGVGRDVLRMCAGAEAYAAIRGWKPASVLSEGTRASQGEYRIPCRRRL